MTIFIFGKYQKALRNILDLGALAYFFPPCIVYQILKNSVILPITFLNSFLDHIRLEKISQQKLQTILIVLHK